MKNGLLILTIILSIVINSIAQPRGSTADPGEFKILIPTGGGGILSQSLNRNNIAYYAELGFTTDCSKPISLVGQMQYSSGKVAGLKLQNIETPLSLHYNFTPKFSIGAGGSYRYLLKATDNGKAVTLNNNQNFERGGFSWLVETSAVIPKTPISLQVRYTSGSISGYLPAENKGKLNIGLRYYLFRK